MGYMVNRGKWSLKLGPSDPVWIAVNPERLGGRKIPHGVGGEYGGIHAWFGLVI